MTNPIDLLSKQELRTELGAALLELDRKQAENERLRRALKSLVEILAKRPGKEITRRDKNDMIQLAWEQGVDALKEQK